jgi:hypothetical protein
MGMGGYATKSSSVEVGVIGDAAMRKSNLMMIAVAGLFGAAVAGSFGMTVAQEMPSDYQEVLKTLDKKGDFKAGVLKVNIPRNDLKMTIQGVATPTSFGFGGWVALTKGIGGADVMMGDLVLTQEEVNPVMSTLLENGIDVTALHNHFFWDDPHVYFMHVHGIGTAAELARRTKPGLDLIGHVAAPAATPLTTSGAALDTGIWRKLWGTRASRQEPCTRSLWDATTWR